MIIFMIWIICNQTLNVYIFAIQEQSTIDNMIERILTHMLSLIRCERAMLLLVHEKSNKTFSRVFDLDSSELEELDNCAGGERLQRQTAPAAVADSSSRGREGRFPVNAGITGFVAATGETVNIADAYSDDRFDQEVRH